ncbi:putative reverse transcriptase domain-containing protein [Tanacetum coccineum]
MGKSYTPIHHGKKHGRMMLDSIDNGPLVYPTVEEEGQTQPKKYSELTEAQQLQDDCDVQATNIILHGLPPDVYALVNHQEMGKDIWDNVKLMKDTELSYQERECRLYNLFDKFASVQGETLYEYYWRFSQLINDMHTIGMTMQQVQVNTKVLNALLPEWSKVVTDVKLAKSLYTTNYDQLYAFLSQHERHAQEVCVMRERYPDPLALVANSQTLYNPSQSPQHSVPTMHPTPQHLTPVYATPIHHQQHHTPVNPLQQSVSPQPFISSLVTQQPQAEFPQLDSGLAVPTFQQGEHPIDCINKAMAFLSAVASRFPPSNNQLKKSSNPRNQATIQDGRVTVQQIQGRQTQSFAGTGNRGIATTSKGNYAANQPKVMKCYNCQGEGHMSRQCTHPKKPRNAAWFKEKLMLAKAQEAGQILDEEQLSFLTYHGIKEAPVAQQTILQNLSFQTKDLDAYDSDCDDLSSAKAVLMANLSSCDSDVLSEVPYSDSYPNDMINQDVQEMSYSEQTHIDDYPDIEINSDCNNIP